MAPAAKGGKGRLRVGDHTHDIEVRSVGSGWEAIVDGERFHVGAPEFAVDVVRGLAWPQGEPVPFRVEEWQGAGMTAGAAGVARSKVRAPMSGKLVEVRVQQGAAVRKGDVLFVLEAMKMQNEVRSPAAGVVSSLQAKAGETLDTERVVLEIESS